MAVFQPGDRGSFPVGADLTGKRYRQVKLDSNGAVVLATAGTDNILGTLDNEPKLGATADVVFANAPGTFKGVSSGVIAKDAFLTATTDGKLIGTTTAGHRVVGRNSIAATVDGEIFEFIKHNEKY